MIVVDAHCDTITKIMETGEDLYSNKCHIDLQRLKKAGSFVQFFASFNDPAYGRFNSMRNTLKVLDKFYKQLELYSEHIMLCCNYEDIQAAILKEKIAAVLSIEGGEALQGDLSALRIYHRLGVRSICLTWNYRNEIADGVSDSITGGGLTPFGREVVKEMNLLGMLIDVSHISEKGFWDVIELTTSPIIASHSNSRNICDHKRNLWDDQLIAVKKSGGVVGINLFPDFLSIDGKAGIKEVISHIEHIISLTGSDNIGLGADFDGIDYCAEGINGAQDIHLIFNELARLNYSNEIIEKLAGLNFLRVIKEVCV